MNIYFSGEVVRVITEYTYVNGLNILYFNNEEFMNEIRTFYFKLKQIVGHFYDNHYAVEIKVPYDSSIYVGINDGEMTIGSASWSHGKVKELIPKENKDKRISFSFNE